MSDQRTFSQEELTGYLDGEIAPDLAEQIRAAAIEDRQLAQRIEDLRIDSQRIKTAMDALLGDAPAAPGFLAGEAQATAARRPAPRYRRIAASLVCLLIGGLVGVQLGTHQDETWQEFAATYHALYVSGTLSHVNRSSTAEIAELQRVSQALGKTIGLGAVSGIERLDYKRAQVLGFEGQPIVQLAFLSKIGAPIALCIKRSVRPSNDAVHSSTMRGMSAVTWAKDNYEFLLVGGTDRELLEQAAKKLSAKL